MQVPLIDLQKQYQSLKPEIDEAIARVLAKGMYVIGEEVEKFEEEWARYCKAKYCVAVSSGTDAIYLSLRSIKQVAFGNVWTTPRTFIGTAEPALRAGYDLIISDTPEPSRFDVYIPVHLYGRPEDFSFTDKISTSTLVIEDAAQAHGLPLGGYAMCHSFYPTKNLGAYGQGGAVVTNEQWLAERVRQLRSHGEGQTRFKHEYLSGNYRMDELQAAILRAKLPHLDSWNKRRREIAGMYSEALSSVPGITLPEDHPEHVYHIYAIACKQRGSLASYLNKNGIQTAVRYPIPLHLQPALQGNFTTYGPLGPAEEWANTNLSLPIYPEMENSAVEYVCESVKQWSASQ